MQKKKNKVRNILYSVRITFNVLFLFIYGAYQCDMNILKDNFNIFNTSDFIKFLILHPHTKKEI